MLGKRLKQLLVIIILITTFTAFGIYIHGHPEIIRQLGRLSLAKVGLLLSMYGLFLGSLIWIQRTTLLLCHINLKSTENVLLVIYSTVLNFFGPLQSGPAFRGIYLKQKYDLDLRLYTVATLIYYGLFAAVSAIWISAYLFGAWVVLLILGLLAGTFLIRRYDTKLIKKLPAWGQALQLKFITNLAAATILQLSLIATIYYIELNSLGQYTKAGATIVYSGAANFALFVSLTPGAIGFREAFLVFSQQLHHFSNQQIVTAGLIDRGVYVIFLGILFVVSVLLHAKQKLSTVVVRPNI